MRRRGDDGQLILLVVFYALIAAAMVVVAVDASILFLAQRSLAGAADGAAVAASQALDEPRLYAGTQLVDLPLAQDGVTAAVSDYLLTSGVGAHYARLSADASTDGQVVTVTLRRPVHLPFLAFSSALTRRYPGGNVTITVTARARAPLR